MDTLNNLTIVIFSVVFIFTIYFQVETFSELAVWRGDIPIAQTDPPQAKEKLKTLIGSLVIFPWDFLKKENLTPTIR